MTAALPKVPRMPFPRKLLAFPSALQSWQDVHELKPTLLTLECHPCQGWSALQPWLRNDT